MRYCLSGITLGLIIAAATIPTAAWAAPAPQAQQESPYKDQGEYDLATAASKETDPQKKLDKVKEWEQKYPDSKLKATRTLTEAQALLAIALASYGKTTPQTLLDNGQKAAQQIVDNLDKYFADDVKASVKAGDDQWKEARRTFELQAHTVLGWVAYAEKKDPQAEAEFKKVVELAPNTAQVSYWLGTVIIRQKDVKRYSEALYAIAHAVGVTGQTALPAQAKEAAESFLKRAYVGYHGDETGLDQLKQQAMSAPLPPADFHIDSVTEIEAKKFGDQEAFNKAHPDIALWRQVRDTLKGDGGDAYFQQTKGSEIPTAEIGKFKAKVVSVGEKELVVAVDNAAGDGTLKFEKPLNAKVINEGDSLEFKGVIDSYTKDPYMLTMTIDDPKESVTGLADGAFSPAPAKKAGPKKAAPKGAVKKK